MVHFTAVWMRQILFRIPGFNIPVYGFGTLVVLGVLAGTLLAARRSRKEGLNPDVIYDLAVWVMLGGLIGARLFYVAEYWGESVTSVSQIFRVWEGGIVLYGAVIGGLITVLLYRVWRPFPLAATLDTLAPSLALGVAIGRVGCFLNGCCYGDVCHIPWLAVRFPAGSVPWHVERVQHLIPASAPTSLPLHPTQLYSALDALVLLALLTAYYPIRSRDGEVFALLMVTYPITRFLIEALRDDETPLWIGMTVAQIVSLFVFLAGLLVWSTLARRRLRTAA